jgi:hypothetical protein
MDQQVGALRGMDEGPARMGVAGEHHAESGEVDAVADGTVQVVDHREAVIYTRSCA